MIRSRWAVRAFIALNIVVPLFGTTYRLATTGWEPTDGVRFSWHMFSSARDVCDDPGGDPC